jgi:anti-sigma-K factor RskA
MNAENHVTDYLPAYALEILEDDELDQVNEHLASCPSCRLELEKFQSVVEQMPLAAPEHTPPPDLKGRILAAACTAESASQPSKGGGFMRRLFSLAPVWGAASLALVILLGISNLLLWQRVNQVDRQMLRVVNLRGTDFTPQATGMLVISRDGNSGTLVVDNLPALEQGRQYQLWLIQDGQRTSGGIFDVDPGGYGSIYVESPQSLVSYSAFGITIEPTGGSPGPTGEKVLGGEL